jgi:hypothetical protein
MALQPPRRDRRSRIDEGPRSIEGLFLSVKPESEKSDGGRETAARRKSERSWPDSGHAVREEKKVR